MYLVLGLVSVVFVTFRREVVEAADVGQGPHL